MTPAPQANFDRVAKIYRWAEYLALGTALQNARTHFLPALAGCRRAFLLGDGDGRFLAELLRRNTSITATAVDTSGVMLALLSRRCSAWQSRFKTSHAMAGDVMPEPETDLVVSHFFLDCLSQQEVNELVQQVSRFCQAGTLWLISDFQFPQGAVLRTLGRMYIGLLYAAFRLLTGLRVRRLPSTREALEAAHFRRIAHKPSLGGMLYTEIWSLAEPVKPAELCAQPEKSVEHPLEVGS